MPIPTRHLPEIPDAGDATVTIDGHTLALTNLHRRYWPNAGFTKADLARYYLAVAPALLPHLAGRPCMLRCYPSGIGGNHFDLQRAPAPSPVWVRTCRVRRTSGAVHTALLIEDRATLLWVANLNALELHPSYARWDAPNRPDVIAFDLDPTPGATFDRVRAGALLLRDELDARFLPSVVKTSGGDGLHVYVAVERGPTQQQLWRLARDIAEQLVARQPSLFTLEHRAALRPRDRVCIDLNQGAVGRTLASAYSPRPTRFATVSTPLAWREVEKGVLPESFRLDTVPARAAGLGDPWSHVPALGSRTSVRELVDVGGYARPMEPTTC